MKATALAPANIAFIKYWGKKDDALRIPMNASVSMNLSEAYSVTTVEFSDTFNHDDVAFIEGELSSKEIERIIKHIDRIRKMARFDKRVKVRTKNTFPKSTGIASSASGFAALTLAGAASAGLSFSEKEISILARTGSGSACRSIPDGFVQWNAGSTSEESFAYSLCPPNWWDIRDILVIIENTEKKVSSAKGMEFAATSPCFQARLAAIPERISRMKKALKNKDMSLMGSVLEEDCLDMHHVMQTQNPPLYYWNDTTIKIMHAVENWRKNGLAVYFTIDAGPNVHLICEAKDEGQVLEKAKMLQGIQWVLVNKPAQGAHLIETHLF